MFTACKLYPAHATTNSAHGVTDIRGLTGVLETMQRIGMPLLIHGEVNDRHVDIFDREAVLVETILAPLVRDYPALKIVLEHITAAEAAAFVAESGPQIAATITPRHLIISRNAIFDGGIPPHACCLPVAKRETHRLAVRAAAVPGSPKFFLGTDSFPARSIAGRPPAAAPGRPLWCPSTTAKPRAGGLPIELFRRMVYADINLRNEIWKPPPS